MTIEDATIIFGKPHEDWTEQERIMFVRALTIADMRVPHNVALAASPFFRQFLPGDVAEWLAAVLAGARRPVATKTEKA